MANIINTHYNSKRSYCGWAHKKSLVYLSNNDHGFSLPGWGDPQVSKSKLPIEVKQFDDFTKIFDNIKPLYINDSKLINVDKKKEKPKDTISTNILKGFLEEDIIVENSDGDEEELEKGTYIVYDKDTKKLIEPKEYKGIELDEEPTVSATSDKRSIIVHPSIKNKRGKYFVYFEIDSNVNIGTILFNEKKLKIKERTTKSYFTKGRRIKDLYAAYPLELVGEGFELHYECRFSGSSQVHCETKEKPEL